MRFPSHPETALADPSIHGFRPDSISIPEGFIEIYTWKGKVDGEFLSAKKNANAKRILELGAEAPAEVSGEKGIL